jgi:ribosomal protein L44E
MSGAHVGFFRSGRVSPATAANVSIESACPHLQLPSGRVSHPPNSRSDSPLEVNCKFWAAMASSCACSNSPAFSESRAASRSCQAWVASSISGVRSAPQREHNRASRNRARQTGQGFGGFNPPVPRQRTTILEASQKRSARQPGRPIPSHVQSRFVA